MLDPDGKEENHGSIVILAMGIIVVGILLIRWLTRTIIYGIEDGFHYILSIFGM
jgi:hypothetical protein